MSLIVSIISQDRDFDTKSLEKEIPSPHNNLFGFENCRQLLWGHSVIKELGCHRIYSLREIDVYAYDDEVTELKMELEKILENVDLISQKTNYEIDFIEYRIKNALEVIKIVERNSEKTGVALW